MSHVVLDAGALIALDRRERQMWRRWEQMLNERRQVATHAGIIAQVWRDPARQAMLARVLRTLRVQVLDEPLARAAGVLLARTSTSDVHDAVLALMCRPGDTLVTGDYDDLALLLAARGLDDVRVISP